MATPNQILADFAEAQKKLGRTGSRAPVVTRKGTLSEAFANVNVLPGAQKKVPDAGGWKGLVQDVMGSPVGKVLTGAGEALALPGRAATSGLKELLDVVDTDPNTAASWDDFKTQVKDPTFGFGRITGDITGNKWVDRAIGFVGDVALDPLTYVTLGTSKFAGSGGRFALANLAKKTIADIDPVKLAKVVRYGRSALDAEDIARLGINRTGLYMFGKRIAGTGKIGEVSEDILSKARVWTSDTRLGRAMQKSFTPGDMRDLRLALMRGEVPDAKVGKTLSTIISRDTQRAMNAESINEGRRRVVLAAADKPEFESVRENLYKYLENEDALASAPEVVQRAHDKWRKTLNSFWDDIQNVYRTIQGADDSKIGFRTNYVPWVETDDARLWRSQAKSDYSRKTSEYLENPFATVGVYNPRSLKEGSEWFGTVLTKEDLNIDRLNEIASLGGFKGKYFETDLLKIMDKYVNDYAEQMGIAARYKELHDNGVIKEFSERAVDDVVVDDKAVNASKARVVNLKKDVADSRLALVDSASRTLETVVSERSNIGVDIGRAKSSITEPGDVDDALERMEDMAQALNVAENKLDAFNANFKGLVGGLDNAIPISAKPVVEEINKMKDILSSIREEVANARAQEAALEAELAAAKEADRAAIKARQSVTRSDRNQRIKVATQEYSARAETVQNVVDYNMLITENWEAIRSGLVFSGEKGKVLNNASSWLGYQTLTPQARGKAAAKRSVTGSLDDYIKGKLEGFAWFQSLTSKSKINKTKVASGSDARFVQTVGGLVDEGSKYLDDARADGIWAIARDERYFNGDLPRVLVGARSELEDVLAAAEDAIVKTTGTGDVAQTVRGINDEARAANDLIAIAPEVEAAGNRLKRFKDFTDDLEVRGLNNSYDPVSVEDQRAFIAAVLGDKEDIAPSGVSDDGLDAGSQLDNFINEQENIDETIETSEDIVEAMQDSEILRRDSSASYGTQDVIAARESVIENSRYLKNLDEIISRGVKNYKELYERVNEIKTLISSRQWKTGKGASERVFTAEDALARRNAVDGKSELERSVDRTNKKLETVQSVLGDASPEDAAIEAASKMSQYYVVSETIHRFYGLVQTLAPYGATPSREMLVDLMDNVSRPFIDAWKSRVARLSSSESPQLEQAKKVLATLEAAASNPSDDFYAMLLGDAGQRLKNSVAEVEPKVAPTLSEKSKTALDSATDSIQSTKADPAYLKSMHDSEIVDALDYLSSYDLGKHTLPDGTKGFLVRDVEGGMDVLTLPDGTPLSFTDDEWESLFTPPGMASDAQRKAFDSARQEISSRAKKVEAMRAEIKMIDEKRIRGTATQTDAKKMMKLQEDVRLINSEIQGLMQEAEPIRQAMMASDPMVRASALEKARILVNGNGRQAGWDFKGVPMDEIRTRSAAKTAARKKNINDSWRATEEGVVNDGVKAASVKANLDAQKEMLKSPTVVANHAKKIRGEADAAAARAAKEEAKDAPEEYVSKAAEIKKMLIDARSGTKNLTSKQKEAERTLRALEKSLQSDHTNLMRKTLKGIPKAEAEYESLADAYTEAASAVNTTIAAVQSSEVIRNETLPRLERYLEMVEGILAGDVDIPGSRVMNAFGAAPIAEKQVGSAKGRGTARASAEAGGRSFSARLKAEEAAELIRWSARARAAVRAFNLDPDNPIAKVMLSEAQAESRFLMANLSYKQELNVLAQLKKGDTIQKIVREVDKGWTDLGAVNLPRMQMPKDLADAMMNLRRVDQPEVAKQLNKFLGKYTQYFKAYATLSPGFHVRNAISNTMMVFAAGSDPRNMVRGLEIYSSLRQAIRDQVPFATWVEQTSKKVSPEEMQRILIAVRASEAAGGGRIEEAFADFFKQGQRLSDNVATRASRRLGEKVEGSGRFMLAYDSAAKGLDFNASTARVRRYLFDYNDVGSADMAMRQIIPFWMWMSRNLPLQIVNQWTEPRTYAIYNQFIKNFGEEDEGEVVPKWLKQQGAVKVADNWYLSFDIGTARVKEQFEMLGSPTRFLKDVNPLLRVPFEVGVLNKKLYRGVPFSDKPVEVAGGPVSPALLTLAKLLGQTEQLPNGGTGVTDKFNYAFMNLNPLGGTMERLLPSSEFYEERQLGSLASFFGLPVRQVTEGAREAELRRRKFEGE